MSTLRGYGLDSDIIKLLHPYIGQKQAVAIDVLHHAPFSITREQADALDRAVHEGYLRHRVIPFYNSCGPASPYEELPEAAQTVIMSLCFQLGCNGARKHGPKTWEALLSGNWQLAADKLCTAWTETYPKRRKLEGQYLQRGILR